MSQKKLTYLFVPLAIFALCASLIFYLNGDENLDNTTFIVRHYDSLSVSYKVEYPKKQYDFCGENMPVHQSENYKKFNKEIRHFLAYRNGLKQLFRRADYYLPSIEKRLYKCNLPNDLKYIPMIESRFLNDTSSKGAAGFWQFMPATAQQYGLVVNDSTDERHDIKRSTSAACSYLNAMHYSLRSWTLTAAAFNAGLGKVDYKISNNDEKIYPTYYNTHWNPETSAYIFRLLAIKHIYENRTRYDL